MVPGAVGAALEGRDGLPEGDVGGGGVGGPVSAEEGHAKGGALTALAGVPRLPVGVGAAGVGLACGRDGEAGVPRNDFEGGGGRLANRKTDHGSEHLVEGHHYGTSFCIFNVPCRNELSKLQYALNNKS